MLARLIKTATLVALATGCAIAASVFLTMDLYFFIESRWGTLITAAGVAALPVRRPHILLVCHASSIAGVFDRRRRRRPEAAEGSIQRSR
jgi:hypothetical protein